MNAIVIQEVENRRANLMDRYVREKTKKQEERDIEGTMKARTCHAENETRQHEDHLKHFQVARRLGGTTNASPSLENSQ